MAHGATKDYFAMDDQVCSCGGDDGDGNGVRVFIKNRFSGCVAVVDDGDAPAKWGDDDVSDLCQF